MQATDCYATSSTSLINSDSLSAPTSSLPHSRGLSNTHPSQCIIGDFFLFFAKITSFAYQLLPHTKSLLISFLLVPFLSGFFTSGIRTLVAHGIKKK